MFLFFVTMKASSGMSGKNKKDMSVVFRIQKILNCTRKRVKKGNIQLPVYRCARGTTSLESFHLHLNNVILGKINGLQLACPSYLLFVFLFLGTPANDMHFQAFPMDGLYRCNAARASVVIEAQSQFRTFDLWLQEKFYAFSKDIFGSPIDPLYHPPSIFTGELIGIEYLYFESEKTIQELLSLPQLRKE